MILSNIQLEDDFLQVNSSLGFGSFFKSEKIEFSFRNENLFSFSKFFFVEPKVNCRETSLLAETALHSIQKLPINVAESISGRTIRFIFVKKYPQLRTKIRSSSIEMKPVTMKNNTDRSKLFAVRRITVK